MHAFRGSQRVALIQHRGEARFHKLVRVTQIYVGREAADLVSGSLGTAARTSRWTLE